MAQVNNLGLLKKLKAELIVSSKASEEVILRRNHFHHNCTFNLSLHSYTIPREHIIRSIICNIY